MMHHHAPWSHQGILHALEHLKEHLIHIVKDVASLDKLIKQPDAKAPTRKFLPILGQETANAREEDEEDTQSQESILSQNNGMRVQLMSDEERDEMSLL